MTLKLADMSVLKSRPSVPYGANLLMVANLKFYNSNLLCNWSEWRLLLYGTTWLVHYSRLFVLCGFGVWTVFE